MRNRLVQRSHSLVPRFAHGALAALLVVATAGSAGAGVDIGLNFTGRVNSPPPAPAYFPDRPDAMGAVGEEHIVELLNDGYAVYRKSNGTLVESSTLTEFWRAAGVAPVGLTNDPRVLYDAASRRWFAVSIDGALRTQWDPNNLLVAVSKSADPTQGWAGFQIYSDPINNSFWADFKQLGMDAEASIWAPLALQPDLRGPTCTWDRVSSCSRRLTCSQRSRRSRVPRSGRISGLAAWARGRSRS